MMVCVREVVDKLNQSMRPSSKLSAAGLCVRGDVLEESVALQVRGNISKAVFY